jgi:hypothetical protein
LREPGGIFDGLVAGAAAFGALLEHDDPERGHDRDERQQHEPCREARSEKVHGYIVLIT